MVVALTVFVIFTIFVIIFLHQQLKRPKNYPPGPQWLPMVGNVTLLRSLSRKLGAQHLAFKLLLDKYCTPILGLKLGQELVVVVSSYKLVRQILTREEFEGRPDTFFIRLRSMGTRSGVTCTDGELWREQRSFVLCHLRRLGFGKFPMEEKVIDELKELTGLLRDQPMNDGIDLGQWLAPSVLNVLWALTAGERFSREDKHLTELLKLLAERGKAFDMAGGTLNQLPWLRHIAPEKTGYNLLRRINKDLKELLLECITEHQKVYLPNVTKDLIDAFLHEMNADKDGSTSFTEAQLIMVCLDLFIAGSQTTSNTLNFAFLAMILHPDVQSQVFNELNSVIGTNRLPELNDLKRLPYTEAVLIEVQRLYHVTPVIGPRRVMKDTSIHGYQIPKETTILIDVWSIHMDQEHWGDPHNFRPSRFINDAGDLVVDEWLLPFGLGRRRCLGEALAKSCIFLFFTGILQQFQVMPVSGKELPSSTPNAGITLSPKPYNAVLIPRLTKEGVDQ